MISGSGGAPAGLVAVHQASAIARSVLRPVRTVAAEAGPDDGVTLGDELVVRIRNNWPTLLQESARTGRASLTFGGGSVWAM